MRGTFENRRLRNLKEATFPWDFDLCPILENDIVGLMLCLTIPPKCSAEFVLGIKEDNSTLQDIQRDTDIDYQLIAKIQLSNKSIFSFTYKTIKAACKSDETYKETSVKHIIRFP